MMLQECDDFLQDAENAEGLLAHYGLKRRWETRFLFPLIIDALVENNNLQVKGSSSSVPEVDNCIIFIKRNAGSTQMT